MSGKFPLIYSKKVEAKFPYPEKHVVCIEWVSGMSVKEARANAVAFKKSITEHAITNSQVSYYGFLFCGSLELLQ